METDVETRLAAALAAGRQSEALGELVRLSGPEVLSFLTALHRDADVAAEVFAETCEDLVRTIDRFRGECSLRTWFFVLARTASRRFFAGNRRGRVNLSDAPELEAAHRTTTARFLQTDWKARFRALRDELSPDDRALLMLRVDRGLSWEDVARVMASDGDAPSAAALRKRFERIKDALRDRAKDAGWLEP